MTTPKITKLELVTFEYQIQNMGRDYYGFNQVYEAGSVETSRNTILRIHTNLGITGEYAEAKSNLSGQIASYLIGANPFEREKIYNDLKRGLRHTDRTTICMIDVALWDLAGKAYGVPIYQLLGGYKSSLPAYASTYHGDENGGLSSPEAFADFALHCKELGYPAFKIHGWGNGPIQRAHGAGQRSREQHRPLAAPQDPQLLLLDLLDEVGQELDVASSPSAAFPHSP